MVYNSFIYLIYLGLKNIYRHLSAQNLSDEQVFLQRISGKTYTKENAEYLWKRIGDHKWYISEKLGRDVGFNVAALDFLENIVEIESELKNPDNRNNSRLSVYTGMSSFA